MQNYRDLEIYQLSHKLAIEVHKMTLEDLPKFEMYEEGRQIRKSSKSIPATIVEGFGRKQYQQEYIRYITYAIASCDETKEHLELLFETGSFKKKDKFAYLLEKYEELGKKLYCFRAAIENDLSLQLAA
jgi:four helix bundle protein